MSSEITNRVLDRIITIHLAKDCKHCIPKIEELNELLTKFEHGGIIVRDFKIKLELTSDWIGRPVFHLNNVSFEERNK